jgi:uncharacterized membrane protein
VTDTDTASPRAGLDRRRDLRGWLITPLLALLLAPAATASVGVLIAKYSTAYPRFCAKVLAENRCEETIAAIVVTHARIFAAGLLLLLVIPWWRGLRPYRIWLAVMAGAVLVAAPLRLVDWSGLYEAYHWDRLFSGGTRMLNSVSSRDAALSIFALVIVLVPLVAFVVFLLQDRRLKDRRPHAVASAAIAMMMLVPCIMLLKHSYHPEAPDWYPSCAMYSGDINICPGG